MAWLTPTLKDLVTALQRGFTARLSGADAALARNNLAPTAKIIAGGLYELHRFAAWAADQRFVHRCDDDQLDRHGAEMKPPVPRRRAAAARGLVTVAAGLAAPVTVATGAVLSRSDGVLYTVDAGILLAAAATGQVRVTASVAAAATNADAGTVLTAQSGLTGEATFTVPAEGLGAGADIETASAYRARILFAKAYPDHAGAPADWVRYALTVPGVTRVFIDPLAAGRGTVVVYPMFDLTRPDGIGLESDRLAVEAALTTLGPGAAMPIVRLPVAHPVNVTITNIEPATPEVRNAVTLEVAQAFFANGRVSGASEAHPSMPFLATPARFSRSWVWQAAANATGEESHVVVAPGADVILAPGEIATLGTVSLS